MKKLLDKKNHYPSLHCHHFVDRSPVHLPDASGADSHPVGLRRLCKQLGRKIHGFSSCFTPCIDCSDDESNALHGPSKCQLSQTAWAISRLRFLALFFQLLENAAFLAASSNAIASSKNSAVTSKIRRNTNSFSVSSRMKCMVQSPVLLLYGNTDSSLAAVSCFCLWRNAVCFHSRRSTAGQKTALAVRLAWPDGACSPAILVPAQRLVHQ